MKKESEITAYAEMSLVKFLPGGGGGGGEEYILFVVFILLGLLLFFNSFQGHFNSLTPFLIKVTFFLFNYTLCPLSQIRQSIILLFFYFGNRKGQASKSANM